MKNFTIAEWTRRIQVTPERKFVITDLGHFKRITMKEAKRITYNLFPNWDSWEDTLKEADEWVKDQKAGVLPSK